ncbi:predicted protein [Plenodomus lingam JN3]|uniref:Predicted protein n=1 Tax=Leptosphaeria maculans (strain JN3 / isolate v23.1.3 / race Av1-4-5-6-7-8) TaxID=985895 RepID=E4ZNR0_LEPMJ|nr:predicted protein [Plenodomus lingam JN3]CBX93279.1 predicted protein [Plenodomus lingam JN3]
MWIGGLDRVCQAIRKQVEESSRPKAASSQYDGFGATKWAGSRERAHDVDKTGNVDKGGACTGPWKGKRALSATDQIPETSSALGYATRAYKKGGTCREPWQYPYRHVLYMASPHDSVRLDDAALPPRRSPFSGLAFQTARQMKCIYSITVSSKSSRATYSSSSICLAHLIPLVARANPFISNLRLAPYQAPRPFGTQCRQETSSSVMSLPSLSLVNRPELSPEPNCALEPSNDKLQHSSLKHILQEPDSFVESCGSLLSKEDGVAKLDTSRVVVARLAVAAPTTFSTCFTPSVGNNTHPPYESRDDPSLDFQALCLRTPIRNAHRHILESSHSDLSLTSWPCSHNLEPMLIGSYLAGLVILSIVPLLFFIARYLAKRTKSQSWNIDDTLLLLALVTKDTILSPRLANASWEAVPILMAARLVRQHITDPTLGRLERTLMVHMGPEKHCFA